MPQRSQRAQSNRIDCQLRVLNCGSGQGIITLCVLCVLCGYFLLDLRKAGAAPQEVVPVDGATFRAKLVSIDTDGRVTFRVFGGKEKDGTVRTILLKDLVRWGNPVAPRAQTIVVLADGGQIVTAADWTVGATVKLDGRDVVVVSDMWGDVRLARGLVRGIVFAQQQRVEDREKLVERLLGEASQSESADAVLLTNGDRLTGTLTELDRGLLAIDTRGGPAKAPLTRVEAICFGDHSERARDESAPKSSAKRSGKLVIGMRDGSLVYANAVRANEKSAEIALANGVNLKGDAADDIVAIQSLDGPVVYLSELEGADYRGVPYLSVKWPFTRDRNVLSEPIMVRGKRYVKGIGMHSAARLTYRLDDNYRRFDLAVAVDDSAKGRGSVTFGVYALRDGKWGEAYKSGIVRGGDEPLAVSVDMTGAKGLTLTVDFADRGDEMDHAVWLDARLVR
jgi:sRNA-binding regulator protein Hfq